MIASARDAKLPPPDAAAGHRAATTGGGWSHRRAVLAMVVVTLMWSVAGVVSRQLVFAHGFEVTFWRSAFTAIFLIAAFGLTNRGAALRTIARGGRALWISGVMWAVMYTCFMLALTITTVANVLITLSVAPFVTALLARMAYGQRIALRTWIAIVVAGAGIAWMFAHEIAGDSRHLIGTAIAAAVPLAAALNYLTLQHTARERAPDFIPAVLIGAAISAAATLPLAWPFRASLPDLEWLAFLGVVQLALPCMLVVRVSRALPAHEVALLGLLEVVLGVLWTWLGAGEAPSGAVLLGGGLVLSALLFNEVLASRATSPDKSPASRRVS